MKKYFLSLVLLFLISACGAKATEPAPKIIPTEAPVIATDTDIVPTVTPVCASSQPAQDDIDRVLSFTGDLFSSPEWVRTDAVVDGRASALWSNDPLSAVAYVEALIFPCGYEEPDLDNYYSDATWKVIFSNYDSYEPAAVCKIDNGIRLYEFKVVTDGSDYNIKYWAQNDTDHRVLGTMIVFPAGSQSQMDEYAADLFPNFTSCQ
jgi:hypothetical protein